MNYGRNWGILVLVGALGFSLGLGAIAQAEPVSQGRELAPESFDLQEELGGVLEVTPTPELLGRQVGEGVAIAPESPGPAYRPTVRLDFELVTDWGRTWR